MSPGFPSIQLAPRSTAAKFRRGERVDKRCHRFPRKAVAPNSQPPKDFEAALAGQDFAPGATFWCVGPGVRMRAKLEESGQNAAHIVPVVRVIGLNRE